MSESYNLRKHDLVQAGLKASLPRQKILSILVQTPHGLRSSHLQRCLERRGERLPLQNVRHILLRLWREGVVLRAGDMEEGYGYQVNDHYRDVLAQGRWSGEDAWEGMTCPIQANSAQ